MELCAGDAYTHSFDMRVEMCVDVSAEIVSATLESVRDSLVDCWAPACPPASYAAFHHGILVSSRLARTYVGMR